MKLLLLVQSEQDVSHLHGAATALLNTAITGVWCVFSPAVLVNASEAAAKLDAEIGQLKAAEKAAAERGDYTAAAGYKTQREGRELDRAKEISEAHKKVSEEDRAARTKVIFAPFIEQLKPRGLNVKITGHSDHYDREQWVQMLNSLSGVWFKEFVPGSFVVAWPEAVESAVKLKSDWAEIAKGVAPGEIASALKNVSASANLPKPTLEEKAAGTGKVPTDRRAELEATHHMSLRPIAKGLGIDPAGKSTPQIIDAILAAEQKPAVEVAPETVDQY